MPTRHSGSTLHASTFRIVASLDRKRLGTTVSRKTSWTRGVFDEEASRKPLARRRYRVSLARSWSSNQSCRSTRSAV